MTQMILNIENPKIVPSLRKVLGQINGVSISKTRRTGGKEKEEILQSIGKGYKEVMAAQREGRELPKLEGLIAELRAARS